LPSKDDEGIKRKMDAFNRASKRGGPDDLASENRKRAIKADLKAANEQIRNLATT
jgi:hypothetical protein